MRMSKKFKTCYISCLPARLQAEIKREIIEEIAKAIKSAGLDRAEMKELTTEAMASRVADVESLIEIRYF